MGEKTWKLYSPLSADCFPQEVYNEPNLLKEKDPVKLYGESLVTYIGQIRQMVDHHNDCVGDLAGYIRADLYPALARKVISIVPSVEVVGSQLMGCATVRMRESLVRPEINLLRRFLTDQYMSGWGRICGQDGICVNEGVMFVQFGDKELFHITINRFPKIRHSISVVYPTAGQRPTLRVDRTDEDINIFSAFALAFSMLNQLGQTDQAKEMSSRILVSGDFDSALSIVREYMNVLDFQPVQQEQPGKPKNKGDGAR